MLSIVNDSIHIRFIKINNNNISLHEKLQSGHFKNRRNLQINESITNSSL